jgi:HSP20 family molecular chaperone IbpA
MALPVRLPRGQIADPLDIIRQDFAMLNRMFGGGGLAGDTGDGGPLAAVANFGVDIREDDNRVYIEADLPGFRKDEVDISIEDDVLTISAEHREEITEPAEGQAGAQAGTGTGVETQQQEPQQQGQRGQQGRQGQQGQQAQQGQRQQQQSRGNYLLQERRYQRLVRSFTLPPNVDTQDVQASLENGVLRIVLNKREDTKPRKVKVA